jgi:hypothetical protein
MIRRILMKYSRTKGEKESKSDDYGCRYRNKSITVISVLEQVPL